MAKSAGKKIVFSHGILHWNTPYFRRPIPVKNARHFHSSSPPPRHRWYCPTDHLTSKIDGLTAPNWQKWKTNKQTNKHPNKERKKERNKQTNKYNVSAMKFIG